MRFRQTWAALPILFLLIGGCGLRQDRDRFLIPAGYVGWIHVQYGVRGAPPLPEQNGFRLLRLSASGRLRTSSPQLSGWLGDEFCYVSAAGRRRLKSSAVPGSGSMVWDRCTLSRGGGRPGTTDVSCFIGTEAQFNRK